MKILIFFNRVICLFILLILVGITQSFGQPGCPAINAGPDVTVGCGNNCTTLNATVVPTGVTTSYSATSIPYAPPYPYNTGTAILVNIDDTWSSAITLPFTFCYYGNSYTQIVAGSNGLITFDLSYSGGFCAWSYTDACPSPNLPLNSIFGPYHDIDPGVAGTMYYAILGNYPCRTFVVSWNQIAMFSCNSMIATHQIVLYESTNIIEVYIQDKPLCSSWNSGNAVVGIQNSAGTIGITAPGRNTSQWTATNEAWRFTPNGNAGYTVAWFDGTTQIGTGASILVCPNATTTYTAQAIYNTCSGSNVTVTDEVTVNYNGNFSITASPTSATLCPGDNVTITATAPPNVTFSWDPPAGLNTITGSTVIASPTTTTTYTVTGVDPTNCSMSIPITVTVTPNPIITIDPPNASICLGSSVDLTAHGADTYVWSPATGLSYTSDSTVTATPVTTTTYLVTGTTNGCSGQASVTVDLNGSLNVSVTPPNPGTCIGGSVDMTASGAITYSWSPPDYLSATTGANVTSTPPVTTTYTVTGTDADGCQGTTLVTVNISTGPIFTFNPSDPVVCKGESVDIQGYGATTYLWSPPTGLNTTSGSLVTAAPFSTITYTVLGDNNGCSGSAILQVVVSPTPDVIFSASPTAGCEDLLVTFFDQSVPAVSAWYWNFGDGTTPSAFTEVPNPSHLFTEPGKYDVSLLVTSADGCQSQLTIPEMITVFKNPIASFYPNPQQTWIFEPTINFFDESINTNSWSWDFGELFVLDNYSNFQFPSHTYSDTGIYTIMMAVMSPDGCVDTMRKTICVEPNITFYIPNAFTPNGDGKNDEFFVKGEGIDESTFIMRIFDRWGKQVFFTVDMTEGWKGTIDENDNKAPSWTFCYTISFKDIIGKHHEYTGIINRIR